MHILLLLPVRCHYARALIGCVAGAKFKTCDFGTDCADCGARITGSSCVDGKLKLCGLGCTFSNDGRCDDGGPGSQYSSCSLGSDCQDCGPRPQACGTAATESYTYDTPEALPPPSSPSGCIGSGDRRCIPGRCSMTAAADCKRCDCIACGWCTMPAHLRHPPSSSLSPPPPPPAPSPPFEFSCSALDGRENVLLRQPRAWCYTLPPETCNKGFTFSYESASSHPSLSLCRVTEGKCGPLHIDDKAMLRSPACARMLRMPPSPPPAPSPPPVPPSPPPTPSAPPPPDPCIPLSAKCGGVGWTGLTKCCEAAAGLVSCYKKNAQHSQCRTSCRNLKGWECANEEESRYTTSSSPPPPPPPSSKTEPKSRSHAQTAAWLPVPKISPNLSPSNPAPLTVQGVITQTTSSSSEADTEGEDEAEEGDSKDEEGEDDGKDDGVGNRASGSVEPTVPSYDLLLIGGIFVLIVGCCTGGILVYCCLTLFGPSRDYAYSKVRIVPHNTLTPPSLRLNCASTDRAVAVVDWKDVRTTEIEPDVAF